MTVSIATCRAFVRRIGRRFVEERFGEISASLAYTTLFAMVPLVAVILAILSAIPGFFELVGRVDHYVVQNLLPERSAGMIVKYVLQFSNNADRVTVVGLGLLLFTVYLLLHTIERAFNHVWAASDKRPFWRRLRLYVVVLATWPLAISALISAMSYAVTISLGFVEELSWLRSLLFKLGGLVVAGLSLGAFYYAVPNARVAARDALSAGFFAALVFFVMKKAFELYLAHFATFSIVYGAFASVPIFLLWLYLSWAVLLLGALLAATLPEFRAGHSRTG